MERVIVPKKGILFITALSLYITLITYFMPVQIPCLFKGDECTIYYGFPFVVYRIEGALQLTPPHKNYLALPENFIFWFAVLTIFYVVARVIFGVLKGISDNR